MHVTKSNRKQKNWRRILPNPYVSQGEKQASSVGEGVGAGFGITTTSHRACYNQRIREEDNVEVRTSIFDLLSRDNNTYLVAMLYGKRSDSWLIATPVILESIY